MTTMQYHREGEAEETAPLYKATHRDSLDFESAPSYPPRHGQSRTITDEERSSVKYTFVPRWPIVGDEENALGVLGRTKEVSDLSVSRRVLRVVEDSASRSHYADGYDKDEDGG
jgi:hypothetical protein